MSWEERARAQIGCMHQWSRYHSFDKTFDKNSTHEQCSKCNLVIRTEKVGNLTPIHCNDCGEFIAYKEDMIELVGSGLLKCKKCGYVPTIHDLETKHF